MCQSQAEIGINPETAFDDSVDATVDGETFVNLDMPMPGMFQVNKSTDSQQQVDGIVGIINEWITKPSSSSCSITSAKLLLESPASGLSVSLLRQHWPVFLCLCSDFEWLVHRGFRPARELPVLRHLDRHR